MTHTECYGGPLDGQYHKVIPMFYGASVEFMYHLDEVDPDKIHRYVLRGSRWRYDRCLSVEAMVMEHVVRGETGSLWGDV